MKMKFTEYNSTETNLKGIKDNNGKIVIEPKYHFFYGQFRVNFIACDHNSNSVFLDNKNKVLQTLSNNYTISDFNNGISVVTNNSKYGIINYKGSWIVEPIYDYIAKFTHKYFVVGNDDKWAIIDAKGKFLYDFSFDYISRIKDNLYLSSSSGGMLVNKSGIVIEHLEYVEIRHYNTRPANAFAVKKDEMWALADKNLKPITDFIYRSLQHNNGNQIAAENEKDLWGFIDSKGKIKIPFMYEFARPFSYGVAVVRINELWGAINTKNEYVVDPKYDNIEGGGRDLRGIMDGCSFNLFLKDEEYIEYLIRD